jgi:hypothetical protein
MISACPVHASEIPKEQGLSYSYAKNNKAIQNHKVRIVFKLSVAIAYFNCIDTPSKAKALIRQD